MMTMTTAAEEKIRELMQEEQDTIGLRVYVKGGGCHGYQYGMSVESKMSDDDTVIENGDVKVIMDSQSAPLLIMATGLGLLSRVLVVFSFSVVSVAVNTRAGLRRTATSAATRREIRECARR